MGVRTRLGFAVLLVLWAVWAACAAASAAASESLIPPSGRLQAQPANATLPASMPRSDHARRPVVPDVAVLHRGKAAAAHGRAPSGTDGGTGGVSPDALVVDGRNQPGLAATDNSAANQGSPPDTTGAIGISHYVEFVNSKVGVYNRSNLGFVTSRDLDAFVGRSGQSVFDPQIQWDQQAGRWLYVAVDVDATNHNFLAFGWSKTADPSDLVRAGAGSSCRPTSARAATSRTIRSSATTTSTF